jgi:hypothetical protein
VSVSYSQGAAVYQSAKIQLSYDLKTAVANIVYAQNYLQKEALGRYV